MCAYEYPITTGQIVYPKSMNELEDYCKNYCVLFDIHFFNIESKIQYEHFISSSKCDIKGESIEDNGRVVYANELITTITNVDFQIIKSTYVWDKVRISNVRIYKKGYLPKDLILTILKLYSDKTTLKGVKGREIDYLSSKENVNSVYGMMVMNIVREIFNYDNDNWFVESGDVLEQLDTYNKSKNRFLFYPFGVWVTAYARRNLWTGILECKNDYVYSDTDSCKILNYEKHKTYFENYNNIAIQNLKDMCKFYNIDYSLCEPMTIKGVKKTLGVWDFDGSYNYFKTLG